MKKTLTLIFICLFLGMKVFAASSLEDVCEKLAATPNTTGTFTQTKTLLTNGRKLKSSGKFIFCNEGILWKTEKPVPSSLILTKDTMIQISANGTKSVMDGKDNQIFSNISDTLSSVFSGDAGKLKKNFNCTFSEGKNGEWKLSLLPKDSTIASVMKELILCGVNQDSDKTKPGAALTSLEMIEKSDNTILYEFSNQNYPKELSIDEKKYFVSE